MNPDGLTSTSTFSSLELLGKSSATLIFIILLILGCAWLLKRFQSRRPLSQHSLKVVSSVAVGQKERVVIVDAENTRLVLGVTGGGISKLHSLPVPEQSADSDAMPANDNNTPQSFADPLRTALHRQVQRMQDQKDRHSS